MRTGRFHAAHPGFYSDFECRPTSRRRGTSSSFTISGSHRLRRPRLPGGGRRHPRCRPARRIHGRDPDRRLAADARRHACVSGARIGDLTMPEWLEGSIYVIGIIAILVGLIFSD